MEKPANRPKVLLAGDVMADIIVRPQGPLRRGSDRRAEIEIKPGGSAANQAVWLAACGVAAKLIARVGENELASLKSDFLARGVDAALAGDATQATGALISMVEPDGERSFFTDRGANENLCFEDVPEGAVREADLLLLSGYSFFTPKPRKVARALMAEAKLQGIPVAIDPSSAGFLSDVGPQNFLNWTQGADILFPNEDEAALLSGQSAPVDQIKTLAQNYRLVVLKLGAQGACAGRGELAPVCVGVWPAKMVDSTGAGDAFAAGFISAHLEGKDLAQCLEAGAVTGARAVSQLGGRPGE